MKYVVLVVLFAVTCSALPQRRPNDYQNPQEDYREDRPQPPVGNQEQQPRHRENTTPIAIIRFDKEQGNDGSYKASWETANDIQASEEGFLKELGPDPDAAGEFLHAQVQQGSYSYTAPDGQIITVNYIADETGFHATGDHLPTPPPVSPEVQKGLDLIFAGIKNQQDEDAREGLQQNNQNQNQNHN